MSRNSRHHDDKTKTQGDSVARGDTVVHAPASDGRHMTNEQRADVGLPPVVAPNDAPPGDGTGTAGPGQGFDANRDKLPSEEARDKAAAGGDRAALEERGRAAVAVDAAKADAQEQRDRMLIAKPEGSTDRNEKLDKLVAAGAERCGECDGVGQRLTAMGWQKCGTCNGFGIIPADEPRTEDQRQATERRKAEREAAERRARAYQRPFPSREDWQAAGMSEDYDTAKADYERKRREMRGPFPDKETYVRAGYDGNNYESAKAAYEKDDAGSGEAR